VLHNSNLLYNACLAPGCPHYLKIGSMKRHLGTWVGKLPKGLHMFTKSMRKQRDEDIFNRFVLNGYKVLQTWEGLVYHVCNTL
jgi:hypothetical protein